VQRSFSYLIWILSHLRIVNRKLRFKHLTLKVSRKEYSDLVTIGVAVVELNVPDQAKLLW